MRALIECETYDARVINKAPVPPTKVDTLVCDLWALATNEIGIWATSPLQLTSDDLAQAIQIYESTPWKKIRGYRPWTHWHFINRLNSEEREALAREAHTFMLKNGIKNGQ